MHSFRMNISSWSNSLENVIFSVYDDTRCHIYLSDIPLVIYTLYTTVCLIICPELKTHLVAEIYWLNKRINFLPKETSSFTFNLALENV